MSATDAPPLNDRSDLSRDAGDVPCPECGRFFTPGGGLARHRSRIHHIKPTGTSTTYKAQKRERDRIAAGDEPLWESGRDLPPRTRSDSPPPFAPPSPAGSSYTAGMGGIGVMFTALGVFDEWDQQHWSKASPGVAKQWELFVIRHPKAKPMVDMVLGGGAGDVGAIGATLFLLMPMLAHHGRIPWPGIEPAYPVRPLRIPRPPRKARPGSGVPQGAVVGDSVPPQGSRANPPPPSDQPDPTMYGPPAESIDPNQFTAADGPAAGIPPDAATANGATDEFGEPL